jgi:hypothetical protein
MRGVYNGWIGIKSKEVEWMTAFRAHLDETVTTSPIYDGSISLMQNRPANAKL